MARNGRGANGESKTIRLHAPSSDIEKMETVQIHPHTHSRDDQKKKYQSFKPESNDSTGEEME